MKRTLLLSLILFMPVLLSAQLSKKDQKAVKKYTKNMCECMDDLVNTLNPTAVEYLRLLFDEGEANATTYLNDFISSSSSTEIAAVNDSFTKMADDSFGEKIEDCDDKEGVDNKVARDIDNQVGDAHEYFMEILNSESSCYWLKHFYEAGTSE